jgi:hypothetical protein
MKKAASTGAAADALNRRGMRTASGKQWHPIQVHRVRSRLGPWLVDRPRGFALAGVQVFP